MIRAAKPRWSYLPTSGEGAARRGGRFNRIGEPTLYTSLTHEAAAREVRFSLNQEPYTFYFLAVDCCQIVDMTSRDTRNALGISWNYLANDNWESEMHRGLNPSTHVVADKLKAEGYAGILVNSFAPGATPDDVNLVLWNWEAVEQLPSDKPNAVMVLHRDDLPSSDASWK
ncbi:RES family NAD+ phosphorylase [Ruegeria atlantica]|uniref:RES family NAD+ phosphorylase n=1 Tax=Ruegeria atlantica TaxID=81569 RepID=UPI00147D0E57